MSVCIYDKDSSGSGNFTSCSSQVLSPISIELLRPLKEIDDYKYIVIVVGHTGKSVEVEPLKEKNMGGSSQIPL